MTSSKQFRLLQITPAAGSVGILVLTEPLQLRQMCRMSGVNGFRVISLHGDMVWSMTEPLQNVDFFFLKSFSRFILMHQVTVLLYHPTFIKLQQINSYTHIILQYFGKLCFPLVVAGGPDPELAKQSQIMILMMLHHWVNVFMLISCDIFVLYILLSIYFKRFNLQAHNNVFFG